MPMETDPLKTEEPLITAEEAHKAIPGLKRGTLYRMAKLGLLDGCYYVGEQRRGVRFKLTELLTSLKKRPTVTTPTPTIQKKAKKTTGKATKKAKAVANKT